MINFLIVTIWIFSLLVILKYVGVVVGAKNKESRIDKMISDIPSLTTGELKEWYVCSDTDSMLESSLFDKNLHCAIEKELSKRGLEYMKDY